MAYRMVSAGTDRQPLDVSILQIEMDRFARLLERGPRRPVWSQALTAPVARRVPEGRRATVLALIKGFHSVAFFSIAGLILLFTWDGLRGRRSRRAALAGMVAIAESAVYGSNNLVCPLTPLAEELGAPTGSVTDIYLPDWLSRRVPLFGGGTLLIGLVIHGRLWIIDRSSQRPRAAFAGAH